MNCNENGMNFDNLQCAKMNADHRKTTAKLLHDNLTFRHVYW